MKITSINKYTSPVFAGRNRVEQNKNSTIKSPVPVSDIPVHRTEIYSFPQYAYKPVHSDGLMPEERTYDSFTGLRDKNYLLATLKYMIKRSKVTNEDISIAMFDLDNFKSVNELLGYEIGDDFITTISKIISDAGKEKGIPTYRFGGDEFIMILNQMSDKDKSLFVNDVISRVNSDKFIHSKSSKYRQNADKKLFDYSYSSSKYNKILELKTKRQILEELHSNLPTDDNDNSSFFIQQLTSVKNELDTSYLDLINECLAKETDTKTRVKLIKLRDKIREGIPLYEKEESSLSEYLSFIYDKNAEIFQIKRWVRDFNTNKGFSLTGAVVDFSHENISSRTPISLINEVGEVVKKGKSTKKGKSYSIENFA